MRELLKLTEKFEIYEPDNLLEDCKYQILIEHDCTESLLNGTTFELINEQNQKVNSFSINNWELKYIMPGKYFGRFCLELTIVDPLNKIHTISTGGFTLSETNEDHNISKAKDLLLEALPKYYKLTFFASLRSRVDFLNYIKEKYKGKINDHLL